MGTIEKMLFVHKHLKLAVPMSEKKLMHDCAITRYVLFLPYVKHAPACEEGLGRLMHTLLLYVLKGFIQGLHLAG